MCFRPPELNKLMRKCDQCGQFNKPEADKCKKCGAPIGMIPCPECGELQHETNMVCKNCGFNGKPGSGDPSKKKAM